MTNNCLPRDNNRRLAFDLLSSYYEDHHREVMAYALYFTRHEDDAHDAMQEAFCLAMENLSQNTETIENPRAWLVRITRNVLLRRQQRSRQESLLWQKKAQNEEKSANFTAGVLNGMLAESITDYIRREFTPIMQEIFVLRHFHEMNLTEIAEVTQMPLTSVHRLLATITDQVQNRYDSLAG